MYVETYLVPTLKSVHISEKKNLKCAESNLWMGRGIDSSRGFKGLAKCPHFFTSRKG